MKRDGADVQGDGAAVQGDDADVQSDGAAVKGDGASPKSAGARSQGDGADGKSDRATVNSRAPSLTGSRFHPRAGRRYFSLQPETKIALAIGEETKNNGQRTGRMASWPSPPADAADEDHHWVHPISESRDDSIFWSEGIPGVGGRDLRSAYGLPIAP